MSKWDEMRVAYKEAESQIRASDEILVDMASMLCGRLRTLRGWDRTAILRSLKRELRKFNITTGRWEA
jgi:hypothetical protein